MSKYLYGASVQGIQDFIFATNQLQEIVGASEIVKSVAKEFEKISGYDEGNENILLNAAGNIKAVFKNKEECEKVVLEFNKSIQQKAYGITISQAVIVFDGNAKDYINELEKKLKIQRNKPSIPMDSSINIMKLYSKTAKPLVTEDNDKATLQKLKAYKNIEKEEIFKNLQNLSNNKNKIAVIHIDGNGLGQLIPKLKKPLSEFSKQLDSATQKAFDTAKGDKRLREIILGGDDITVISDANDALSFTKEFLYNFEKETKSHIGDKLTACAGIAYCNEKYPFHYAVDLAETLCGEAKKESKKIDPDLAPSSLMFHNIQSSNVQSWDKIVKDELTIKNDKETIRCDFGAYYLNEKNRPTIENFITVVESLRLSDSPSSRLRSWLSELYKSHVNAKNFLDRIDSMANEKPKFKEILNSNFEKLHQKLQLNNIIVDGKTPIYDALQILSITTSSKGEQNDA